MKNTKKYIAILLSMFVLIELSLVFGAYDLDIWMKYGDAESKFGLTMEVLGELVAPVMFALSGMIIAIYYQSQSDGEKRKHGKVYLGTIFIVAGLGYSIYVITARGLNIYVSIGCLMVLALFSIIMFSIIKKADANRLFQLYCIAVTTIMYCVAVLVVINIFKISWGRVRPRELSAHFAEFTTFYLPQGINGNRSFPSGHTSNATILYVITMFVPLVKKKISKILLYVIPIIWIIVMAYSRVICGAHYASDVLYGATISIITFYVVKALAVRYIAKTLANE